MLEKHADFLRDFRGDTVHPVTMRLLDELGLFERFDNLPQSRVEKGQFDVDGTHGHLRRLPSPPPAPSVCGDGAAVGSARPDRRCSQGGAHLLTANAARSHRPTARWRHGHRRALQNPGRPRRTAGRSRRRLRRPHVGCPPRRRAAHPRIPGSVRRVVVSAAPRRERAVFAHPPHQTRAGADHDSARRTTFRSPT